MPAAPNASHLGILGPTSPPEEATADLGLLFDETYRGPGVKGAEILKRGPADKRGLGLKAGDVIVAVDRQPVTPDRELSELLNGKVGETVQLDFVPAGGDPNDAKARKRIEVQAIDRNQTANLVYDRWVDKNAERVARLSGGQLGYIHIPNMNEDGLEK